MSVKKCFIGVLLCSFLMTSDINHHLKCLLAIYTSSVEKYIFKFFAHLLTVLSFCF